MNIAIVDDMRNEAAQLENVLKEYAAINKLSLKVTCFPSGEDFLKDYQPYAYTVIFLDIYMGGMNGMETAEKLRELDGNAFIVFLTTSTEHIWSAFSVHAYDYIAKPASSEKLFKVMDDLLKKQTDLNTKTLDFSVNKTEYHIPYQDIVSICTAETNYLNITDIHGQCFHPRHTFSNVCDELSPDSRFLLINRGVLVNMDYIIHFDNGDCYLRGDLRYRIFTKKQSETEQKWQNYTFSKIRSEQRNRR